MLTSEIRRLEREQYRPAQAALGRAFHNYDLMVYAAPDERRRHRAVDLLYSAILFDSFRFGEVYVAHDCAGVACWLPPGAAAPGLWRQMRAGMLALPFRFGRAGFRRLIAYDHVARELHHEFASMPHWYLAAIGVEPEHQGQGIGSELMQPVLRRADAAGFASYLETHRPENVRLYERHGFEVVRRVDLPGHPIPLWAMLRRPQPVKV
jgi:ribosomal protein S18 acetylase RimI-like enzyme